MANRAAIGAAMLGCGTLCLIAAVFCGTNLDRAYIERSSTGVLPNRMPGPTSWAFHQSVLAPVLIWSAFGVGMALIALGVFLSLAPRVLAKWLPEVVGDKPAPPESEQFRRT
jgi:hypothetical protein